MSLKADRTSWLCALVDGVGKQLAAMGHKLGPPDRAALGCRVQALVVQHLKDRA